MKPLRDYAPCGWLSLSSHTQIALRLNPVQSHFLPTVGETGGQVHRGFLNSYIEIHHQIDAVVSKKQNRQALWLAGHSLDGPLATLAATHLDKVPVQGIYTFGGPRVGYAGYTGVLPQRNHYRFVHRRDWVPLIRPEFPGFAHGGTMMQVTGSGSQEFLEDFSSGSKNLVAALQQMANHLRFDMG